MIHKKTENDTPVTVAPIEEPMIVEAKPLEIVEVIKEIPKQVEKTPEKPIEKVLPLPLPIPKEKKKHHSKPEKIINPPIYKKEENDISSEDVEMSEEDDDVEFVPLQTRDEPKRRTEVFPTDISPTFKKDEPIQPAAASSSMVPSITIPNISPETMAQIKDHGYNLASFLGARLVPVFGLLFVAFIQSWSQARMANLHRALPFGRNVPPPITTPEPPMVVAASYQQGKTHSDEYGKTMLNYASFFNNNK